MKYVSQIFFGAAVILLTMLSCSEPLPTTTTQQLNNAQPAPATSIRTRLLDDDDDDELTDKERLGKQLFFDTNLSEPAGQSCGSCHDPASGFAEPDRNLPVSEGVIAGNFGARNALSASYTKFTPPFNIDEKPQGGQFWDGRKIDLIEQAKAPFLNPLEMNNPGPETVVADVMIASYAPLFLVVYGPDAFDDIDIAYNNIADAIATYERSVEVSPFNSKYDLYKADLVALTLEEALGLELFTGKAKCVHCHSLNSIDNGINSDIFTNFLFGNIGLPRNTEFPYDQLPADTIDLGLGAVLENPEHNGKFKTPHLRNIALTAPYMHNGVLKTLEQVVEFYNTRDLPGQWPAPEVSDNMVTGMVGDLELTEDEVEAIVAFMETLTDANLNPDINPSINPDIAATEDPDED